MHSSVACEGSPYGGAPHNGTDTSIAAADAIEKDLPRLRRMTFRAICEAGARGLTAEEASNRIGVPRVSAQPRLSEMRALGLVEDSGQRRFNASGRRAIVWTMRGLAR